MSAAVLRDGPSAGSVPPQDERLEAGRLLLPMVDLCRIGGNGAAAQASIVEGWVSTARPGAEAVYAIGHLPVWAKGPKLARLLADQGYLHLFHDRAPNPKHYVARRTGRPWIGAVRPIRIARAVTCLTPMLAPLMARLEEIAAAGLPCPSNEAFAAELGVTKRQAAYLFCCLEAGGGIRRRVLAEPPFRVVTIVKSGMSTGGVA